MELYEEFSQLKIDENLFKDVKFYITGSIPDWIVQLLINGGAKQEPHITDFITHLITGLNPDDNEIGEVKDIYEKPVVTHHWVTYSAKCGKKLPIEGFCKDAKQLFSGVKASVSKLGIEDSRAVWCLIQFYGGRCNLDLDHTCTHLIVGKPEGIKYNRALEKTIHIVTPDWVTDTIDYHERQDEYYFHPRLLKFSHSPNPQRARKKSSAPKQFISASNSHQALFKPTEVVLGNIPPKNDDMWKIKETSEAVERQSLFDALTFSDDDDDDDDDTERKTLLDQLKNSQPWKKSPTPPPSSILPPLSTAAPSNSTSETKTSLENLMTTSAEISTSFVSSVSKALPVNTGTSLIFTSTATFTSSRIPVTTYGEVTASSALLKPSVSIVTKSDISSSDLASQLKTISPITTSLKSTSEVDISYISKHMTQAVTSASSFIPSQSITGPLLTPLGSPVTSTPSIAPNSVRHELLRGEGIASNVEKSILRPGQVTQVQLLHSRSVPVESKLGSPSPVPPFRVGTVSGNNPDSHQSPSSSPVISVTQTPTSYVTSLAPQIPFTQQSQSITQSPLISGDKTSNSMSNIQVSTQSQLPNDSDQRKMPPMLTSSISTTVQPSTLINQQPVPEQITSQENVQLQQNMIKQSNTPMQVIHHGSISVAGNQGPPNVTIRNTFPGNQLPPNAKMKQAPGSVVQVQHQTPGVMPSSGAANVAQQQVHSVAIPGAVVRLPAGVTHQQLQMMTNEERHKFLDQLHKKQLQEQLQRGKPRPGKPYTNLPYKNLPPGATIHYSNIPKTSQQQLPQATQAPGTWPSPLSQTRPRAGVPIPVNQSTHFNQDSRAQVPNSNVIGWQQQTQQSQLHQRLQQPQLVQQHVQQSQLQQQVHQPQTKVQQAQPTQTQSQQQLQQQSRSQPQQQVIQVQQNQQILQQSSQPQAMQQTHIIQQQQQPHQQPQQQLQQQPQQQSQPQPQQQAQPQPQQQAQPQPQQQAQPQQHLQSPKPQLHPNTQQQFVLTQGTATRVMVGQPNWQQQSQQQQQSTSSSQGQVSVGQPNQQGVLPQHIQQVQVHAQQLRQHFPHLTQQEAQQLIQTIPTHLREIQSRDNAGRFEYLSALEPRERQIVNHFYVRRHQQQMLQRQQLQAQQAQLKIGAPQQSPSSWQQQHSSVQYPPGSPHARTATGRPVSQGLPGQAIVSLGQGSPHLVQGAQLKTQVAPLASPHGPSTIQRADGTTVVAHPTIHGPAVTHNLLSQQNLVNSKTKTALANLLTNRLSTTGVPQGSEVGTHIVQKSGEIVSGPGGEHVTVYQRRTLANITGNLPTNIVRVQGPAVGGGNAPNTVVGVSYPRGGGVSLQPSTGSASGYPRPHLYGHDINTMLPRELCMVGCVFYIADYHSDVTPTVVNSWKRVIQQHGGEVVNLYDSVRVTHVLCKHQRSPVFQQAVRENKRCITIYWLNDILIRGKMAPPWQAIHLPTPFDNKDKPMKGLLVSVSGFENEERTTIKLMLQLAGAEYTGHFSKFNNLVVCKKFEGSKVIKAKDWKKGAVNGMWLSEVLLGQNTPPLVYQSTRYQLYLDDPLRIDPSLASHLFNAWKLPISVSKESVEKAKSVREMALRKRKSDNLGEIDNITKRTRLDSSSVGVVPPTTTSASETVTLPESATAIPVAIKKENPDLKTLRVLLSSMKNKEELERKVLDLGGILARTTAEATHLVMGTTETAPRTVKLMCAVSNCRYILSYKWIIDSSAQDGFLEEETYSLRMPEFEKLFYFRLKETLAKPNRNELLKGLQFYLTPSVVPGRTWLKEIIMTAGGNVDVKRRSLHEIRDRNKDVIKYICVTTDSDSHLVKDVLKEKLPVYNSEFILIAILQQKIDFDFAIYHEIKSED